MGFYKPEDSMAQYKPSNENQMVMLPISLQDQLVAGTLEHTINRLVDENIDLSVFDERYKNDLTGAAAIHPKILLKVILLAYAKGMISSRQTPALLRSAVQVSNAPVMKTSSSLPSHTVTPLTTARLLHLSLPCKTRFLPSSATYSWCVKNWNCSVARTSAWMG